MSRRQLDAVHFEKHRDVMIRKRFRHAIICWCFPNDQSIVSSVIVFRSSPEIGVFLGCRWRRCW
jgi:hypothetical protein